MCMLLSMFLSLLVARRLRGKTFALVAIIISGLIAFFSVGIPSYVTLTEQYSAGLSQSGVLLESPRPLSFPFYAYLSLKGTFSSVRQDLQLSFAGSLLHTEMVQGGYSVVWWLQFSLADYANFFSLFVLVNIVGSALGYWLSKRAFIDRLSKPVKRVGPALIAVALTLMSVYFLFSSFQLWNGYNWAMWRLQYSMTTGEGGVALFYQLLSAISDYVSLFPVRFFAGLIFGTFALVIVTRNSRKRVLIIASIAIVSSAVLFFEGYKIWETYNLATHQVLGPLAYLTYFNYEATYVYQTLFWPYFLSGSVAVASGIILITLGRLKAKLAAYWIKREQSRGIVV